MTCEQALLLISGHIDRENTKEEELLLQAHLLECEDCRNTLQAFLDMEINLSRMETLPADLHENVMTAIHVETSLRKKKSVRRWSSIAAVAALVAVIGISGLGFPPKESAPAAVAVPMMARSMPEPTCMEMTDTEMAQAAISPQDLADKRQADVAVTYELLPEMEVCSCETLETGELLYLLETADGAVRLSRLYGLALYQPVSYTGNCSYVLLLPVT